MRISDTHRPRKTVPEIIVRSILIPIGIGGLVSGCANRVDGFDIAADYTFENPAYSEPDSMFMIDSKPVLATIAGAVPGVSEMALRKSVADGMSAVPPIVCCAGADKNFKARAPLSVMREPVGAGREWPIDENRYRVAWSFDAKGAATGVSPVRVTAAASLYRGRDLLTQADGRLDLSAAQAGAVPEAAMIALVKTVEGELTFYPSSLVVPNGGGG